MTTIATTHHAGGNQTTQWGDDWRTRAACLDADTNLFYTVEREGGRTRRPGDFKLGRIKSAKEYCDRAYSLPAVRH